MREIAWQRLEVFREGPIHLMGASPLRMIGGVVAPLGPSYGGQAFETPPPRIPSPPGSRQRRAGAQDERKGSRRRRATGDEPVAPTVRLSCCAASKAALPMGCLQEAGEEAVESLTPRNGGPGEG